MELHLVLIQDVLAQNPVSELSLKVLYLCNVPQLFIIPCLYVGAYHLLEKSSRLLR